MVTTQRHVLANKPQLANVAVYSYNDIQHYDISMYKTLYIVIYRQFKTLFFILSKEIIGHNLADCYLHCLLICCLWSKIKSLECKFFCKLNFPLFIVRTLCNWLNPRFLVINSYLYLLYRVILVLISISTVTGESCCVHLATYFLLLIVFVVFSTVCSDGKEIYRILIQY